MFLRRLALVTPFFLLAACGGNEPHATVPSEDQLASSQTAEPDDVVAPPTGKLRFKIIGSCTSEAGVLTAIGRNFTPSNPYNTEVTYPSGESYLDIANPGVSSSTGTTPEWNWPCAEGANGQGDPAGVYKVKMTDLTTGRTVKTTFTINKP